MNFKYILAINAICMIIGVAHIITAGPSIAVNSMSALNSLSCVLIFAQLLRNQKK